MEQRYRWVPGEAPGIPGKWMETVMGGHEVDAEGNHLPGDVYDDDDGSWKVSSNTDGDIILSVNDGSVSTCRIVDFEAIRLAKILLAMAGEPYESPYESPCSCG